jgi:hypothetical protein
VEKDVLQKERLAKLFWSWGYLTHFNVKLFDPRSAGGVREQLTDVDVLGHKVSPNLHEERVCGDCRTLKGMSSINRAFWQRGVMDYLRISRGYIVVRKPATESHKQTARELGITLLDDQTFDIYCSKLGLLPGLDTMNMFKRKSWDYFQSNIPSYQSLASLLSYWDYSYWTDRPNRALRLTLMEVFGARDKLEEKQKHHCALVLDSATHFSSSILSMIAELFQIHSITDNKELLDDYLKAYIYGGREVYAHLNQITRKLIELKKDNQKTLYKENDTSERPTSLSLPEWDKFLQLYRTLLEAPAVAVEVPRILRFALFERILYNNESVGLRHAIPSITTHGVKLAADVITYFLSASQLLQKFGKGIITVLDELLLSLQKEQEITPLPKPQTKEK